MYVIPYSGFVSNFHSIPKNDFREAKHSFQALVKPPRPYCLRPRVLTTPTEVEFRLDKCSFSHVEERKFGLHETNPLYGTAFTYCIFMQVGVNIQQTAANVPTKQPCLIASHSKGMLDSCFLVIEKHLISKIKNTEESVVVLPAVFYVFNVHYPMGCTNVYTILEQLLLDKQSTGRRPRVAAYLSRLSQL